MNDLFEKIKPYLMRLGLAVLAVFSPIKAAILTIALMTAIDLVSGLLASRKQGIPITSAGLKRTLIKLFVYELVVAMAFLVETYLTGDFVPLVKILAGYVGITELKSVLENIEIITGMDIIKMLIDKLASNTNDPPH